MLTSSDTATHSPHCALSVPRVRTHLTCRFTTRHKARRENKQRQHSFSARLTEPASLNQYDSSAEARNGGRDNSELNELARMMPDPAEDELFDDNYDYDGAEEGPDDDSDLLAVDMGRLNYHVDAKQRWEKEKAEQRAFELFHEQGTSSVNLYAQTHAMAIIMDDIETEDKVEGRGPSALPTWVRAQFRLDECWDDFAAFMERTEARVAIPPPKPADPEDPTIEDTAREMLAEGNFFQSAEVLEPVFSGAKDNSSAAESDLDDDLAQFMTPLPGTDSEENMVQRMMGGTSAPDDEDTDDP